MLLRHYFLARALELTPVKSRLG